MRRTPSPLFWVRTLLLFSVSLRLYSLSSPRSSRSPCRSARRSRAGSPHVTRVPKALPWNSCCGLLLGSTPTNRMPIYIAIPSVDEVVAYGADADPYATSHTILHALRNAADRMRRPFQLHADLVPEEERTEAFSEDKAFQARHLTGLDVIIAWGPPSVRGVLDDAAGSRVVLDDDEFEFVLPDSSWLAQHREEDRGLVGT